MKKNSEIKRNNLPLPLKKQIEPAFKRRVASERIEFCEERKFKPSKYLIHRYPDRAVVLATNQCFAYCRFCFRSYLWRESGWVIPEEGLNQIIEYLTHHSGIKEIIISGGDPLILRNSVLRNLIKCLNLVKQVNLLRIASRALTFCPARIDSGLLRIFQESQKQVWFISHFNHPAEMSRETRRAIKKLIEVGIPILNQTVLLKGINDRAKILLELFEQLASLGIKPYYLFQCDPVAEAEHFCTELEESLALMESLSQFSGLILPKFAFELPGYGKLCPSQGWQILKRSDSYELVSPRGEKYFYPRKLRYNK